MLPISVEYPADSESAETILVAEDEVIIRLDISEFLRERGYHVIEANDAAEAIQVLKSVAVISAVFTDVRMPGTIDGIDLARYVQTHHPNVPVVITSGHIRPQDLPESLGPLIGKPYDPTKVLKVIQEELEKRARE